MEDLHAQGARVTFWLTSIINTDSENYQEACTLAHRTWAAHALIRDRPER